MENREDKIHLYGTDNYMTEGSGDVYRVCSGTVLVFVAPLKEGRPNRRLLLCEVSEGHLIPSFTCRDSEYVKWRFVLVPKEDAVLEVLHGKATSVLYRKFAAAAGLENYQQEGFSQSLIEYYKRESLKDDVYIGLGKKNRPSVDIASYGVIKKAFDADGEHIDGNDPLYKAIAFACSSSSIPILDPAKTLSLCGNDLSVPAIARACRFGFRRIVLEPEWYHKDCGVILSSIDGSPVSCVPRGQDRYIVYHGKDGRKETLTKEVAETIEPRAFTIFRTLPPHSVGKKDLIRFCSKSVRRADLVSVIVLGLVGALIGILLPTLNQKIYDEYIPLGNISQLAQICAVISSFMIGNLFFGIVKKLSEFRISSHVGYDLQNAAYYRVFHLPESFFRQQESADLAQRMAYFSSIANTYITSVLVSGLGSAFSLLYLYRMFKYSAKLSWMALLMLGIYGAIVFFVSKSTVKYDTKLEEYKGRSSAKLYQFLNGIEKIRMAGVEDRASYEYLLPFAEKQSVEITKNRVSAIGVTLSGSVSIIFSMVFYLVIVRSRISISTGGFMAFNSAFGAFSAAVLSLIEGGLAIYQVKPVFERIKPILDTAQEDDENKEVPGKLRGEVSLNNVRFSYDKNGTYVLNGIDLKIAPGEYIGIVGSSGCGKSTLLKLLLGFEEPDQGQVCYDGKNLKQLDKREVRKNLGVVLQNGKLIAGSIYDNITITAPTATMKDVESVVEAVGLKSDIEQMPMGVHTVLSENSGTISGGQQQRILIARAIIAHPSILIFDEATSALDNVTQAAVCESLDKMNVTRIVVAHRLSTIKNCDRIIVLQEGKIVEQGTYSALMEQNGLFHQLAVRQLVD